VARPADLADLTHPLISRVLGCLFQAIRYTNLHLRRQIMETDVLHPGKDEDINPEEVERQGEPLNIQGSAAQGAKDWLRTNVLHRSMADLALAVLAIYAGQYLMTRLPQSREWGLMVLVAGLGLAILRLKAPATSNLAEWIQVGLGFLICLVLALDVDNWKAWTAPHVLMLLWLLSIFLVVTPVLKLNSQPILPGWIHVEPLNRREWGILGILVVVAFLLRGPAIETVPRPVDPDEASLALSTLSAATGEFTDPFAVGWASHPSLQGFIMSPFSRVFGRTFLAMRLPSAVVGTLAVGILYLAARVGWGSQVALLAGVLALSSDVAIHFSRLGVNNISDSLFNAWTVAALWSAASMGRPAAYVSAGIGMGLAQYFYFGNRAIPFIVAFSLLLWSLLAWPQVLRAWKHLLGVALIALVVAGPLLGLWARHPDALLARLESVTVPLSNVLQDRAQRTNQSSATILWHQVRDSLLVFTAVPDRGSFYNSGRPMLPPILAPFFFIGLIVLCSRWRHPASLGTLAWVTTILILGSVLIGDAATFQRLLGLLPAAILVAAVGLNSSAEALCQAQQWPQDRARWIACLAAVIVAVLNVHFYFDIFNTQTVWKRADQEAIAVAALEYEHLHGQGTFVLHTAHGVGEDGTVYHSLISFVAGEDFCGQVSKVAMNTDNPKPLRFYILPDKSDDLSLLTARFPGGDVQEYRRQADGELLLTRYTVP
jgi:4-amino-4-deoxy-L-arabinose transferase-like glycosyltransferase